MQPFGNSLVTMTVTGARSGHDARAAVRRLRPLAGGQKILQVSAGFTYSWSTAAAACSKVDPTTIKINGVTVDPAASYRSP